MENHSEILHIERDSEHTCRVEILDREGEFKQNIGHTTLNNLRKAGYTVEFKTEQQRVEELTPHITDDSFKLGLKANYERQSKKDALERKEKREQANERYIMKQLEGLSLGDVFEKLGVV